MHHRPALAAILAALLVSVASPAWAQSQLEMNMKAQASAKTADTKLNSTYKRLMVSLDQPAQAALVRAELAWIAFRDAECALVASPYEGGSIQPLMYSTALERLTAARTAELAASGPGRGDPQADARLNRLYKELLGDMTPAVRKQLQKAQLAWIAFRDAEAGFQALRFGGSKRVAIEALTRVRADQLQQHINAGEERP